MPGKLYIVATPIGNLEDITLRALRILKEVDLIAAEDTRVTRKLLSHFDIHTPLTSYHRHTRESKMETLLDKLRNDESIALVSDAGTPAISDPGGEIVARAIQLDVQVIPIPGPCAAIAGLIVSGLPTARFTFDGFAPRSRSDRREFFDALRFEARSIVLYESPSRLPDTLKELIRSLGDRPVAVARELTKVFEEVYRGTLAGASVHFKDNQPRGEFTIIVGPPPIVKQPTLEPDEQAITQKLQIALDSGLSNRDAVRVVTEETKVQRRIVYSLLLAMQSNQESID